MRHDSIIFGVGLSDAFEIISKKVSLTKKVGMIVEIEIMRHDNTIFRIRSFDAFSPVTSKVTIPAKTEGIKTGKMRYDPISVIGIQIVIKINATRARLPRVTKIFNKIRPRVIASGIVTIKDAIKTANGTDTRYNVMS